VKTSATLSKNYKPLTRNFNKKITQPVQMNLQGQFLIATPQMPDPRFQETVIYVCAHTDEGVMGLVVNQPVPYISLADVMRSTNIPVIAEKLPTVYIGGPMEIESSFCLYSSEYKAINYIDVTDTVCLSRDVEILHDISQGKGPERYIFILGYSGWAPGQLENELKVNGWLTVPSNDKILFQTPDDKKWREAAKEYGIDITLFGDVIGNA
jgi:putative transcriptional regulator